MKQFGARFGKIGAVIGLIAAVFGLGGAAYAATSHTVVSGTTNHTIYRTGQTINISGVVNGDVFCAGQTVNVNAVVNGDVICAGQTVTVDGIVRGNIRLAGQTVDVGAKVTRNASLLAQDTTVQSSASIDGDIGATGQTVNLNGQIGRDVAVEARHLTINTAVGRNVEATVDSLALGSAAAIKGNLTYTSPTMFSKAGSAKVDGAVTYHHTTGSPSSHHIAWSSFGVLGHTYTAIALLIFVVVLAVLLPQLFVVWNEHAAAHVWVPLVTGFIATFAIPVIIITLFVTVVGVPLAVLIGLGWLIAILFSAPLAAYYVGRLIMGRTKRSVPLIMLAGGLILGLLSLIPIISWLVSLFALWFGTGSVLLNLRRLYRRPEYNS